MSDPDPKADLHRYIKAARGALLWKLDGLSEYDVRRPVTPTGTNLLGLLKHVASIGGEYLGIVFGRPLDVPMPWFAADAEPNADMWATAEESREQIVAFHHHAWAHADATIEALPVDAVGEVPWWPEGRRSTTLHEIMVHVLAEVDRHAGHADIVRETIDGAAGLSNGNSNLPPADEAWWDGYRARLEQAAREAGGQQPA